MPLDLPPSGQNPIVFGNAADRPLQSHARFLPLPIFQEQDPRVQIPRDVAAPNNPSGWVHTTWRPCSVSRNVLTSFPLFPDFPHIFFLLDLLQLLQLLLSWSADGLKPCDYNPLSATHGEGAHDRTLVAGLQLLLYLLACAASPSPSESSDDGSTAAVLAAPSVGFD